MLARMRAAGGRRPEIAARRNAPDYAHALLDEFHFFLQHQYGEHALPHERFVELFWQHQQSGIIRPANRYIGDLWYLFAPDFAERLGEYYKAQELQLTMTFLGYAASERLLRDNYLRPYEIARDRLSSAAILELGPGLPHGFLALVAAKSWCTSLTIVEIDAIYTRFVEWACARRAVPFEHRPAEAGRTPTIAATRTFDFIFAKDVFEHLDAPERVLRELLAVAAPRSVLALDLEDTGAVQYQHISPDLAPLKSIVSAAGYALVEATGNVSVFARGELR
jgi:SAM-dependent methyltransferase